jgi:hypothetical protein
MHSTKNTLRITVKAAVATAVAALALGLMLVVFTGGGVLARWSPFLSDCEKIQIGESVAEYSALMKTYIEDPRYNYMINTYNSVTTISLADDQGHMKTWRCVVEVRDGTVTSVNIST